MKSSLKDSNFFLTKVSKNKVAAMAVNCGLWKMWNLRIGQGEFAFYFISKMPKTCSQLDNQIRIKREGFL